MASEPPDLSLALAHRDRQLLALQQASLALTEDLELKSVLQRVAELSREVIGARYAALGVLDASGQRLLDFITAGMEPEVRRKIAHLPSDEGLLGHLIKGGQPLRLDHMTVHPDSVGFCANHPPMDSLLGVPVFSKGRVLGDLYLSDKLDGSPFTEDNERMLVLFAAHAAAAIDNARQYDAAMTERGTLIAILDSMSEAVFEVDAAGVLTRVNKGTCRLAGRSLEQLVGCRASEVFRWEDADGRLLDDSEYLFHATMAEGKRTESADRFFRHTDGRRIPMATSSTPVFDGSGRAVAVVQVVRDITREREAESFKDQIISLVSHELRTPLAHIKGFASSLLEADVEWDAATQRDFITEIDHEADRLAALVTDLLDMSKIESAGGTFLEKATASPAGIVQQALKAVAGVTADHMVTNSVGEDLRDIVVDGQQIERVIGNLMENAAKYSDPGSEIRIWAVAAGDSVTFCVQDQGPGIADEYRDQIFQKFFRIKSGRPRTPGTGLGLPICRGIVEAHGGRMWFETGEGKGSTFCFSLPAHG